MKGLINKMLKKVLIVDDAMFMRKLQKKSEKPTTLVVGWIA